MTTGKPRGRVASSGTWKVIEGPSALSAEAWSHLALTSDGATLRLYVNGSLVSTETAIVAKPTAANLQIGKGFGAFFDGLIDEVRVYDERLSEGQIKSDRDTPVVIPPSP